MGTAAADALARLRAGGPPLARAEAAAAADEMLDGECGAGAAATPDSAAQGGESAAGAGAGDRLAADLLLAMAGRGETEGELLGFLDAVSSRVTKVDLPRPPPRFGGAGAIDVCGTGGDGMRTVNVSTAAAFVAAGAGVPVAKYGNRSSSGGTGSADIIEALGCDLGAAPAGAPAAFGRLGICFMFAPAHNPAMRNVAAARRIAAGRTAFNVVGPLTNPARVRRQLVGVSAPGLLETVPRLLAARGAELAVAARSSDGMDELSAEAPSDVCEARGGGDGGYPRGGVDVRRYRIDPSSLDLRGRPHGGGDSGASGLRTDSAAESLQKFVAAVDGTAGRMVQDTVELNAGAAVYAGGAAESIPDGLAAARGAVESGRASRLLDAFVSLCGSPGRLEEARGG